MVGQEGANWGDVLKNLNEQLARGHEEPKEQYTPPPVQQPATHYTPVEESIRKELEAVASTQNHEQKQALTREFFAKYKMRQRDYVVCLQCYSKSQERSGMYYAKSDTPPIRPEVFDGFAYAVSDNLDRFPCSNHTLNIRLGGQISQLGRNLGWTIRDPLTDIEIIGLTKEEEFQNVDYLTQTMELFGTRDYRILTYPERNVHGREIGGTKQAVIFYNLQIYGTSESRRKRVSGLRTFDISWTEIADRLRQGEIDAEQLKTLVPRFLQMARERQLL